MSFILQNIAIAWKGPSYVAIPHVLPDGNVFSIGGVIYTWDKLIVVIVTVPVLLGLMWLVQQHEAGQGDARDGSGPRCRRDDGHQRQPDDLVHVPDRGRARRRRRACCTPSTSAQVRYDRASSSA